MNTTTPATNTKTIADFIADADRAINVLNSARKETCAEYNERMRHLRDLKAKLQLQREQNAHGAGELFDPETALNAELQRLLSDPTHNL